MTTMTSGTFRILKVVHPQPLRSYEISRFNQLVRSFNRISGCASSRKDVHEYVMAVSRCLYQRATAAKLDVIRMGTYTQNVQDNSLRVNVKDVTNFASGIPNS